MRVLLQCYLAFVSLAVLGETAFAVEIVSTPTMGLAGTHTFVALTTTGETVRWTVDRITKEESDGSREQTKTKVYTATGLTATFNLSKVTGKQTIWRIRATDSVNSDTQEVQVFVGNKVSSLTFDSPGNPITRVYVFAPASLTKRSRILFAMHSSTRDASYICSHWTDWAAIHDTLVICPRFKDRDWPGSESYNRGNVFTDENNTRLNPESRWSYTVVEQVHKHIRDSFAVKDEYFDMWGHSAGGQFTERFPIFKPNAKVRLIMPANPGWYLLPKINTDYPCGPKHPLLNFTAEDMLQYTQRTGVLFSGTKDTNPRDPETGGCMDAQGQGRYARGTTFYNAVKTVNPETPWKRVDVISDHDGEKMARGTQIWLDAQAREGNAFYH